MTEVKTRRRWPLLVIAAPAAVSVWSGWVGLGEMAGFGVVRPLPGISSVEINTAITLPIGVEAYAVWALSVATNPRMPQRSRHFAGWSSAAGLLIGMGGQIAYHLMEAWRMDVAPWQVVTAVASLPVLVVGAAAFLWHLTSGVEPRKKAGPSWGDRLLAAWEQRSGHGPTPSPDVSPATSPATVPAPQSVGSVPAGGALTSSASGAGGGGLRAVPSQSDGGARDAAKAAALAYRDAHGVWPGPAWLQNEGHAPSTAKRALKELKGVAA